MAHLPLSCLPKGSFSTRFFLKSRPFYKPYASRSKINDNAKRHGKSSEKVEVVFAASSVITSVVPQSLVHHGAYFT